MIVLVINSGSSSLKYQVRDTEAEPGTNPVLLEGIVERIGEGEVSDHAKALGVVAHHLGDQRIDAVGHRVVHGGERFSEPVRINNEVTRAIERLNPLAPLHNPANVLGIRAITEKWPDLPQVAVFDTAFHRTMPPKAWRYAVPNELYTMHGIRRYGFHGTSHQYVAGLAAELLDRPVSELNAVIAHLGNGASATAIRGGRSVDTSMGFTPLEGLVMGTRSGDVDPGILLFLQREGFSAAEIDTMLNRNSGLKALAGRNDMREIVEAAYPEDGGKYDGDARLALDVAAYRLAKYIGGYHVAVGGAQALIFTAGIGENSDTFRALVVEQLGALGVKLDEAANRERSKQPRVISSADSAIPVLVVPTDEERAIADAVVAVLAAP